MTWVTSLTIGRHNLQVHVCQCGNESLTSKASDLHTSHCVINREAIKEGKE